MDVYVDDTDLLIFFSGDDAILFGAFFCGSFIKSYLQ